MYLYVSILFSKAFKNFKIFDAKEQSSFLFLLQGFFSDLEKLKLPNNKLLWTIGTIEHRSVHIYSTLTQRKSSRYKVAANLLSKKILDCCCASFSSYCKSFLNYILVKVIFINQFLTFMKKKCFCFICRLFLPLDGWGEYSYSPFWKLSFSSQYV